ncbi:MAG: AcrR family transcriptional regulator [Spirochaetae bacterium HGW-Spirochaetae-3]|jgi:AcrR family transcriptional regulator|nr:MAG: AcrR family transcriptional regulator [Spirochaetae bacterium HGW-Spirochaetae-3]
MSESVGEDGKGKFHRKTFDRIDPERRATILRVAVAEFAAKGYSATGINDLARKAGISIGSLYSYFASKEDLFLAVIDTGSETLAKELSDVDPSYGFFSCLESLLRKARAAADRYPELNQIYLDSTTQGLASLAARLSNRLEAVTADLYRRMFDAGKASGELRPGVDPGYAAFCVDNLIVMFQFSYSSDYYRDRMRIMLGLTDDEAVDDERLIACIVGMARDSFGARA